MSEDKKPPLGEKFLGLGSLRIVPVKPGHEHEPEELGAVIDFRLGIAYVREEDYPKIRDELLNLPTRQ